MSTDNRIVSVPQLRQYLGALRNRQTPLSPDEFADRVLDWMMGRPVHQGAHAAGELSWEAWAETPVERRVQLTREAHRSDVEWMRSLGLLVERVAVHYAQLVESDGLMAGDVLDAVHRAVVVTCAWTDRAFARRPWQEILARVEELCYRAILHAHEDRAWRHFRPGVDLFVYSNGQCLFGFPFGAVNKNGPRDTTALWPRRLSVALNAGPSGQSDLERLMGDGGGA